MKSEELKFLDNLKLLKLVKVKKMHRTRRTGELNMKLAKPIKCQQGSRNAY